MFCWLFILKQCSWWRTTFFILISDSSLHTIAINFGKITLELEFAITVLYFRIFTCQFNTFLIPEKNDTWLLYQNVAIWFFLGLGTILYPFFEHQLGFLRIRINPCYVICHNLVHKTIFRSLMSLERSSEAMFCLLTTVLAPIYLCPCWSLGCTGIS